MHRCKTIFVDFPLQGKRLRWLGHVFRMPNNRLPEKLCLVKSGGIAYLKSSFNDSALCDCHSLGLGSSNDMFLSPGFPVAVAHFSAPSYSFVFCISMMHGHFVEAFSQFAQISSTLLPKHLVLSLMPLAGPPFKLCWVHPFISILRKLLHFCFIIDCCETTLQLIAIDL